MFEPENKDKNDERIMTHKENEKKNVKLSPNDVSGNRNENTETVVTVNRINTEGL